MSAQKCGGCRDLGQHIRWCPEVVGPQAARFGQQSERIEALADEVGASAPEVANLLYSASGLARIHAEARAKRWREDRR